MSDTLEDWLEFRRGENQRYRGPLCVECDKEAEGNVSCEEGELCDACGSEGVVQ